MSDIITGNISSFSEQIKFVLEKTVKSGQFTTKDNVDEKQLTISISSVIANIVDIYNVVRDGVLYVYIFHTTKKGNKNLDSRDSRYSRDNEPATSEDKNKEQVINYKDAMNYNIILAVKGVANISKNLKKHKLELITKLNDSQTLYKFMNKYLFMVDTNGILFYYPDSIAITSLKSWLESSTNNNTLESILDDNTTLEKKLLLNKCVSLECNLDASAYELYDILGSNLSTSSNTSNTSNTANMSISSVDIQTQNAKALENASNESNKSECITDSADASYSSLGYILSWLNPLAYYNTTNTTNTTSNSVVKITSTDGIDSTASIATTSSNSVNSENKANTPTSLDKSYFLDKSSINCDLIKIIDNRVKILKAQKIEIPAFITDIEIDNVDNINIFGRIDNQPINMKYNKYMIGMHLA